MNKLIWLSVAGVAGVLMVHPAMAQQPSTTSPAGPLMPITNELKFSVTLPEAEMIWKSLRKLPVEEVEQLMAKIRQQVSEQQNKTVDNKETK